MLGKRDLQRGMFEADTQYGDFVGRQTFYGFLASQRGELFRDDDFAALYVLNNGRPSVPPSVLATALLLQTYDGVSDDEAKRRADYPPEADSGRSRWERSWMRGRLPRARCKSFGRS